MFLRKKVEILRDSIDRLNDRWMDLVKKDAELQNKLQAICPHNEWEYNTCAFTLIPSKKYYKRCKVCDKIVELPCPSWLKEKKAQEIKEVETKLKTLKGVKNETKQK